MFKVRQKRLLEYCESEQMSMEYDEQDYLVSFLVVSGLVLRGYEREGTGEKRRTAVIIRLL
jgi:hypothetical protein